MIIETGPREIGFVLWGHCQNLLDDPRTLARKVCFDALDALGISSHISHH